MWTSPWIVLAAAALEALVGYPEALHRRVPHPVAWIGALISRLEATLNRPDWSEVLADIVTRHFLGWPIWEAEDEAALEQSVVRVQVRGASR